MRNLLDTDLWQELLQGWHCWSPSDPAPSPASPGSCSGPSPPSSSWGSGASWHAELLHWSGRPGTQVPILHDQQHPCSQLPDCVLIPITLCFRLLSLQSLITMTRKEASESFYFVTGRLILFIWNKDSNKYLWSGDYVFTFTDVVIITSILSVYFCNLFTAFITEILTKSWAGSAVACLSISLGHCSCKMAADCSKKIANLKQKKQILKSETIFDVWGEITRHRLLTFDTQLSKIRAKANSRQGSERSTGVFQSLNFKSSWNDKESKQFIIHSSIIFQHHEYVHNWRLHGYSDNVVALCKVIKSVVVLDNNFHFTTATTTPGHSGQHHLQSQISDTLLLLAWQLPL